MQILSIGLKAIGRVGVGTMTFVHSVPSIDYFQTKCFKVEEEGLFSTKIEHTVKAAKDSPVGARILKSLSSSSNKS